MKVDKKYIWIGGGLLAATATFLIVRRFMKPTSLVDQVKKQQQVSKGKETATGGGSIIGKKVNVLPTEKFVNVRSTMEIDNTRYCNEFTGLGLDCTHNILTKSSDSPVGTILSSSEGSDGYLWYKIKLTNPVSGTSQGYVREDAVKIQK